MSLGLLAGVAAASLGLLYTKKKEGFNTFLEGNDRTLLQDGQSKYNPLMNLIAPSRNPLLPPNFTSNDVQTAQQGARRAVSAPLAKSDEPSFRITASTTNDIQINPESQGSTLSGIKTCENVKTTNTNAFNKPEFAANCGICCENGVDSQGSTKLGGLFVTEDDKVNAEYKAKQMGSLHPIYTPSVGECKPGRFAPTKADAERILKTMECEKKQNFDTPGCSLCIQDGTFYYVEPTTAKLNPEFTLVGKGYILIYLGNNPTPIFELKTLSDTPQTFSPKDFKEGAFLGFAIFDKVLDKPDLATIDAISVAGYIHGTTITGSYKQDIRSLIKLDTKVFRTTGVTNVDGIPCTVMRPATNSTVNDTTYMYFMITNPFTFLDTGSEDAAKCPSAPFVTTAAGAEILDSSPCYKKGQQPGKYSQDCVQNLFESSGCTSKGTSYPSSAITTQKLQFDANGTTLSLGGISDTIYKMYNRASTGRDTAGEQLAIDEWNVDSKACLGKTVTSVCDKYDRRNGPLGVDCLSYLWQNSGEKERVPGGVGATYTHGRQVASLSGTTNTYCRTSGSMAPVDANGKVNTAAVQTARSKGGVDGVRNFYESISKIANDNSLPDEQRQDAIQQCYGIQLTKQMADMNAQLPDYLKNIECQPQTIFTESSFQTSRNYGQLDVKDNYIIRCLVNISGKVASNWGTLFHLTATGNNCCNVGDRIPGAWFHPGKTTIHFRVGDKTNGNWGIDTTSELPLNQDIQLEFRAIGNSISLLVNGQEIATAQQPTPGGRPKGRATLWAPDPWYAPFKGVMRNFSYCSFDGPLSNVLDSKSGRVKSKLP